MVTEFRDLLFESKSAKLHDPVMKLSGLLSCFIAMNVALNYLKNQSSWKLVNDDGKNCK